MKHFLFILTLLISFNSYALTKQEKVSLINKKSNDVMDCTFFFSGKSAYFKKHNSKEKHNEYFEKSKQALALYQYLQYGIGISYQDIKKNQDEKFKQFQNTIDSNPAEQRKYVNKVQNPRITKEEKACNLALKFPRTALGLTKATKPFYEKDYMSLNIASASSKNSNLKYKNKKTSPFEQTYKSTQIDKLDDYSKKDKNSYLLTKATIAGSCFYLYKNHKSLSKNKKQFNNTNYYEDKAQQANKLFKYLSIKSGNQARYHLFINQYVKDVKSAESWSKVLFPTMKEIKKAKYSGSRTYEKICDETLKFPSTYLNLNGVIKKFYASDYNK